MRSQRGFTLLEVLISMSLFTVLGLGVVLLMRTGIDMWLSGNRASLQEDRVEQSLPRLEEDLRMVSVTRRRVRRIYDPKNADPEREPDPIVPQNRFLSGYLDYKIGDDTIACRYVAFVRDLTGLSEMDMYIARAGTNPKAESYIDGINDEAEFKKNDHLPTGGVAEVLWIWLPDERNPGVGTIYRAYRSPIGGPGTLLDPKNYESARVLMNKVKPQPMIQGVILFDMLFWTQFTTTWVWDRSQPSVTQRPTDKDAAKVGRPPCGPSRTWDSTRGLFSDKVFRLSRGEKSANWALDDIWPRMVRVEFAVNEEETRLVLPLSSGDLQLTVELGDFATGRGDLYLKLMKVGREWVRIVGRDGSQSDLFVIDRRGLRETPKLEHAAESPVFFGRVLDLTITVPSFRDDNN